MGVCRWGVPLCCTCRNAVLFQIPVASVKKVNVGSALAVGFDGQEVSLGTPGGDVVAGQPRAGNQSRVCCSIALSRSPLPVCRKETIHWQNQMFTACEGET